MVELLITLACGAAVGLSLGLTGGGGSLFALPLLVYVLDIPLNIAVPASLLVVGLTALVGSLDALRLRLVFVRPTLLFGVAGIVSAPLGLWLGAQLPESWRLGLFALLAAIMGLRMARSARTMTTRAVRAKLHNSEAGAPVCPYTRDGALRFSAPCAAALVLGGGTTGVLSGVFGVGGGFLIVPILMTTIRLPIERAIASSLLIITLISGSGAASALSSLHAYTAQLIPFAAGGLLGMLAGRWLAAKLPPQQLQQTFAGGLLLVSAMMFIQVF